MKFLLGIDLEDWFQVDNLKDSIKKEDWTSMESRIERNTHVILSILNRNHTKCTFFVLGWIAEQFPDLVKSIHHEGHEIACHGYSHSSNVNLKSSELLKDISTAKAIIESITGVKVCGYRAPNFSITTEVIETLKLLDFEYDSSLMQTNVTNRYQKIKFVDNGNTHFRFENGLHEISLSTVKITKIQIPWAGGFFFRAIPYNIFKRGIEYSFEKNSLYNFYIHPWEFDPHQPRINNIKIGNRIRHYINLDKTMMKFSQLVSDFKFSPLHSYLSGAKITNY